MTKREFLDTVFALVPTEANAIMDAFDEYAESNEPHWILCRALQGGDGMSVLARIALVMIVLAFFSLVALFIFLGITIADWIMGE